MQIWSEGYAITGNSAGASLLGEAPGDTLAEAIEAWAGTATADDLRYLDKDRQTYWGCRLFDNEADARKAFG